MKKIEKRIFPVVIHYSFDSQVPVFIYDTEQKAIDALKKMFDEVVRMQTEENEHVIGEDMEIDVSDDGMWASMTIYYDCEKDVTEWAIGSIYND